MKTRSILVILLAIGASSARAQTTATSQPEPVTGEWMNAGRPLLKLRLNGKAVAGTIMVGRPDNLADVKTGSFDPRTGALKLQGDAKDPETGSPLPFLIEGKVKGDTLRVMATFGERTSQKVFVRAPKRPL